MQGDHVGRIMMMVIIIVIMIMMMMIIIIYQELEDGRYSRVADLTESVAKCDVGCLYTRDQVGRICNEWLWWCSSWILMCGLNYQQCQINFNSVQGPSRGVPVWRAAKELDRLGSSKIYNHLLKWHGWVLTFNRSFCFCNFLKVWATHCAALGGSEALQPAG